MLALLSGGVIYAIGSNDYPVADVQLHDYGIWVTSQNDMKVARVNTEARDMENGIRISSASESFDVLQDDATVIVYDAQAGSMSVADPATGSLGPKTVLPAGTTADLHGQTLAVAQTSSGKVWVRPAAGIAGVNLPAEPVTLTAGAGAVVAAGLDGTAVVAAPAQGEVLSVQNDSAASSSRSLNGFRGAKGAQITTVGNRAVVLDAPTGRLWTSDGAPVSLSGYGNDPILQQPGPAASSVLVATDSNLLSVALDAGTVTKLSSGSGNAAAPVWLSGCAYGAWSSGSTFAIVCGGTVTDSGLVTASQAEDGLKLRVNRGRVVINNLKTGVAISPQDPAHVLADFSAINQAAKTEAEKQKPDDTTTQEEVNKRTSVKTKPVAADDDYGTRPQRSVLVRALENDTDQDGDILAIAAVSDVQSGRAAIVENGQAIQVIPGKGASEVTLGYTISDPDGNTADAKISVKVDPDVKASPELRSGTMKTSVVSGKWVDYDVLAAWRDPWNDPLFVKSVQAPGGTARLTPQGMLTYLDDGSSPGHHSIQVVVSNGDSSTPGTVDLNVLADQPQPPTVRSDVATGVAGRPITVFPLRNDADPNGGALHLGGKPVAKDHDVEVDVDPSQTRLDITAPHQGTYLVSYSAADDAKSTAGVVRVDVAADSGDEKPVAVDDEAFISQSGTGDVDLLANDVDPSGDVLVVQSIEPPADSSLRVAVLEHRLLRVWSKKPITKAIPLTYTVSDGENSATATVLVRSVPADSANQQPVAVDDAIAVRAGDVVDVPVTANDTDPDGDQLTVDPALNTAGMAGGVATVQGNLVRLQAPAAPGTKTVIYTVQDSGGDRASARIVVTVRPQDADPGHNQAPVPPEIIGRTLSGASAELPVPLSGADPDGDSVFVIGAQSPPAKGRVQASSDGKTLLYQALDDASGTDVFSYQVVDAHGASGSATIKVGIAPNTAGNSDPVAVDDSIAIRPGRAVTVPVLDNDVDSDGDTLSIAPDRPLTVIGRGTAVVRNNAIDVTAASAGTMTIGYTAADGSGGYGAGYLVVTADPDAPLLAPVALDDVAGTAADDQSNLTAPVLANDRDPDGRAADLKVTLAGAHADAGTVGTGGRVTVKRAQAAITVAYVVTDQDGQTSTAFIWVPGTTNQPPRLKTGVTPREVKPGESTTLELADWVVDPEGSPVTLAGTDDDAITAVQGDARASGKTAVLFTADTKAAGPAAVSFTVIDETGQTGPARTALITVPIQIVSSASKPKFTATAVNVVRGGKPAVLDLRRFVSDPAAPRGASYAFTVSSAPSGLLRATVSGSRLTAGAASEKGGSTQGVISVTVRRSGGGVVAEGTGTIKVRVGVATRPLPIPHDYTATGRTGTRLTLPWQANVTVTPGETASLVGKDASVTPTEAGTSTIAGTTLTFTPAKDYAGGRAKVSYSITDTPGDATRTVPAQVFVVIQGAPGIPGRPSLVSQADASVTLAWSAPPSNGADIDHYQVSDGAQFSQQCKATTCSITGLSNGKQYRFKVRAVNAVDAGPYSGLSDPVTPDSRPETPAAPLVSLVPGGAGGSLAVSWTPVAAPGGAQVTYEVHASGGAVLPMTTTATSVTFDGLTNGTAYTFKVRARTTGQFTDFGPSSAPQTPIGVPDAPAQPDVVQTTPTSAEVSWRAPAGNGGTVTGYVLRVTNGGSNTDYTVPGSQTSKTLDLVASQSYQFSLRAQNQSGESAFGPAKTFTPLPPPGVVTGLAVKEEDQQVRLSFTAPTTGMAVTEYRYSKSGGPFRPLPDTKVVTGLTNGTSYTFSVEACSTTCGDPTAESTAAIPYGLPNKPVSLRITPASPGDANPATWWCLPESNGRSIVHTEYRINNGSWKVMQIAHGPCNGSNAPMTDYGTETLDTRSVDTEGQKSAIASVDYSLTRPSYALARGDSAFCSGSSSTFCEDDQITVSGDLPKGISQVYSYVGKSGSCVRAGSLQPLDGTDLSTVNGGDSFTVRSSYSSGGYLCGYEIVNAWTGNSVQVSALPGGIGW